MKPLILCINGSPRRNGESAKSLRKTAELVRKHGGRVEITHLVDLKIALCEGCYSTRPKNCTYPCIHDDDTRRLHEKLIEVDGFILASPVWWFGPGPLVENFIAKLTALENNGYLLEGKAAGLIITCGMNGAESVAQRLSLVFSHMGILVPPYGEIMCNLISSAVAKNKAIETALRLGSRIFGTEFEGSSEDFNLLAKNIVEACNK